MSDGPAPTFAGFSALANKQRRSVSALPTMEDAGIELAKFDLLEINIEILAWACTQTSQISTSAVQQAKAKLTLARVSQAAARELADAMSPATGDADTTRVRQALQTALVDNDGSVERFFAMWDVDRSGCVDRDEFFKALKAQSIPCTRAISDRVFDSCDADGSGTVDYDELFVMLYGDTIALDLLALQRAVDGARECAWRCPTLLKRVERANELLEVGRTAQAAWRKMEKARAPAPLEVHVPTLEGAVAEARKSGVPALHVAPAERDLERARTVQRLVEALEEMGELEPLEVDLTRLGQLMLEGEEAGIPAEYLEDAQDVRAEARTVQAARQLELLVVSKARKLIDIDLQASREAIEEAIAAGVDASLVRGAEKRVREAATAQATAGELDALSAPQSLLEVDVEALAVALKKAKRNGTSQPKMAAAALKLSLAKAAQQAAAALDEAVESNEGRPLLQVDLTPPGPHPPPCAPLLQVDVEGLEKVCDEAASARVPEESLSLAKARARSEEAKACQQATAAINLAMEPSCSRLQINVAFLFDACTQAARCGAPKEIVEAGWARREAAVRAHAIRAEVERLIAPALLSIDVKALAEVIEEAREEELIEEINWLLMAPPPDETRRPGVLGGFTSNTLVSIEDRLARAIEAQEAVVEMEEVMASTQETADLDRLEARISAGHRAGVPQDRLRNAQSWLESARMQQAAWQGVEEAGGDLSVLALAETNARRVALEKKLAAAASSGVAPELRAPLEMKLEQAKRAARAKAELHAALVRGVEASTRDEANRAIGVVNAKIDECIAIGWEEATRTWLSKARKTVASLAKEWMMKEQRRKEDEQAAEAAETSARLEKEREKALIVGAAAATEREAAKAKAAREEERERRKEERKNERRAGRGATPGHLQRVADVRPESWGDDNSDGLSMSSAGAATTTTRALSIATSMTPHPRLFSDLYPHEESCRDDDLDGFNRPEWKMVHRPMEGLDLIGARVRSRHESWPPRRPPRLDPKSALQLATRGPLVDLHVRALWRAIDRVQVNLSLVRDMPVELEAAKQLARDAEQRKGEDVYDVFFSHASGPLQPLEGGGGGGASGGGGGGGAGLDALDATECVERISAWLRRAGFRTWIDRTGGKREDGVSALRGIEQSKVVIVVLSQRYIRRLLSVGLGDRVKREFVHAINVKNGDGRLLPIVAESFRWGPSSDVPLSARGTSFPTDARSWWGPSSKLRALTGVGLLGPSDYSDDLRFEIRMRELTLCLGQRGVFPRVPISMQAATEQTVREEEKRLCPHPSYVSPWPLARGLGGGVDGWRGFDHGVDVFGGGSGGGRVLDGVAGDGCADREGFGATRVVRLVVRTSARYSAFQPLELRQELTKRLRLELSHARITSNGGWACHLTTARSACRLIVTMDRHLRLHVQNAAGDTMGDDKAMAGGVGEERVAGGRDGGGGWEESLDGDAWEAQPRSAPAAEDLRHVVQLTWPMAEQVLPRDLQVQWVEQIKETGSGTAGTANKEACGESEGATGGDAAGGDDGSGGAKVMLELRMDARLALILEQLTRKDQAFFSAIGIASFALRTRKEDEAAAAEIRARSERRAGKGYDPDDSTDTESVAEGDSDGGLAGGRAGAGKGESGGSKPVLPPHPHELGRERRANAEYRTPQPKIQRSIGTRSRSSHPRARIFPHAHGSGGPPPTTPHENPARGHRYNVTEQWEKQRPFGAFNARVRIYRGASHGSVAMRGSGGDAPPTTAESSALRRSISLGELPRSRAPALNTNGLVLPQLVTAYPSAGSVLSAPPNLHPKQGGVLTGELRGGKASRLRPAPYSSGAAQHYHVSPAASPGMLGMIPTPQYWATSDKAKAQNARATLSESRSLPQLSTVIEAAEAAPAVPPPTPSTMIRGSCHPRAASCID